MIQIIKSLKTTTKLCYCWQGFGCPSECLIEVLVLNTILAFLYNIDIEWFKKVSAENKAAFLNRLLQKCQDLPDMC